MFRRRDRQIRRAMRRGLFGPPEVPPALRRANALMTQGDYLEAAAAFEDLAARAEARGGPRAPLFHLQAGRMYVLAGQGQAGVPHIKRGLEQLAANGRYGKIHRFGQMAVQELTERGLTAEAQEIAAYLKMTLPAKPEEEEAVPERPPVLPTHCPSCGAPVRSDEVEWMDDVTAECLYCSSPLRAEA
jgi:hypothetical protein